MRGSGIAMVLVCSKFSPSACVESEVGSSMWPPGSVNTALIGMECEGEAI